MSENRFLSYILTEGLLLTVLALMILILPKVTDFSFGFVLCLILIIYGGYKMITSFLSRNFDRYFILNILASGILLITGLTMLILPVIDMTIIVSVLGIYFIVQSILTNSFLLQIKAVLNFPKLTCLFSIIQLFFGILLITLFPTLWVSGILVGLNFLLAGIILINMYITKKLTV